MYHTKLRIRNISSSLKRSTQCETVTLDALAEKRRWSCPDAAVWRCAVVPGEGRTELELAWQLRSAKPSRGVPSTLSVDCVTPSKPLAARSVEADPPACPDVFNTTAPTINHYHINVISPEFTHSRPIQRPSSTIVNIPHDESKHFSSHRQCLISFHRMFDWL